AAARPCHSPRSRRRRRHLGPRARRRSLDRGEPRRGLPPPQDHRRLGPRRRRARPARTARRTWRHRGEHSDQDVHQRAPHGHRLAPPLGPATHPRVLTTCGAPLGPATPTGDPVMGWRPAGPGPDLVLLAPRGPQGGATSGVGSPAGGASVAVGAVGAVLVVSAGSGVSADASASLVVDGVPGGTVVASGETGPSPSKSDPIDVVPDG